MTEETRPAGSTSATPPEEVGRRLLALREEFGYSLRDVERRSDGQIRTSHLSQVETAKVVSPSISFFRELAHVYGMTLPELLLQIGLADKPTSPDERSRQQLMALAHMSEMTASQQEEALRFMKWMLQNGVTDDRPAP